MKHILLTRYNNGIYDLPQADKWMSERAELFKHTRESVLAQDAAFDWFVYFDPRTPDDLMLELCAFPFMFPIKGDARSYVPNEWTITTRLDNDDLLRPNALAEIQNAATMWANREFVVDVEYEKLNTATGECFASNRDRANSPFLSLISNKKNCYCRPHTFMPDDFPSMKIDKVLATMVLHGGNQANTMKS
jgi:hypothetical protein